MRKNNIMNIEDLRDEVAKVFIELRAKTIEVHEAATLAKLADTMIASAKVQHDYNRFNNSSSKIEFLEINNYKTIEDKSVKLLGSKK